MEEEKYLQIKDFLVSICKESFIGGNLSFLHDSLTPEFKEKMEIVELGRRLAKMEDEHGMFTKIGECSTPTPNPDYPDFWIFDITLYVNDKEWFATFSINNDLKINDIRFSRRPFYIAAKYFNPHKVIQTDLSEMPLIRFIKPAMRRTSKIPCVVLIHAGVPLDIDGHLGVRYPFRDIDFLAQKKIGVIRGQLNTFGPPNPIVNMGEKCVNAAASLRESSDIFIIVHGFASLFINEILANTRSKISGIIYANPAWEAIPGSGMPDMTENRVPKGINSLIIGSGFDQVMVKDHWEMWKKCLPEATALWYEKVDHFMMDADEMPTADGDQYTKVEEHVNEKLMRDIRKWIQEHSQQEQ